VIYENRGNKNLLVYTNSDYIGDQDNKKKSISGYVFLLSSGAVSWSLKKQLIVHRGKLHCYSLLCMSGSMVEKDYKDAW